MKKYLFRILLLICILIPSIQGIAAEKGIQNGNILISNNVGKNDYIWDWNCGCNYSYLCVNSDGSYTRVEYTYEEFSLEENASGKWVYVENYSPDFQLLSYKKIQKELPLFGGFYKDDSCFYLVFGQENQEEKDDVEVLRVVKYSSDWTRLGSASVYGANTEVPFNFGNLRMDSDNGYLYIRTCHTMYTSQDGLNHQANMSFKIKSSDMSIADASYKVEYTGVGYVSHSFNQFIKVDNGTIYAMDHGDAYPRAAIIFKYDDSQGEPWKYGPEKSVHILSFAHHDGKIYQYTGAFLGGFEVSNTSVLAAGTSTPQDGVNFYKNIFVTATDKDNFTKEKTTFTWITNYTDAEHKVSNPQMVELNKDSYLLMWNEENENGSMLLRYVKLDGKGNIQGNIMEGEGELSDCQPVYDEKTGRVVWYVTEDSMEFYTIDMASMQISTKVLAKKLQSISFESWDGVLEVGKSKKVNVIYDPADTTDEKKVSWSSDDTSIATVSTDGTITAVKPGFVFITAQVGEIKQFLFVEVKAASNPIPDSDSESTPNPGQSSDFKPTPNPDPNPTPGNQDFPFGDVPKNSWKYEGIKYVYDNQIMKGVGDGTTFAPDDTLTRAMFATVLYRMAGEPAVTYTNKFPDVPAGKWYSNAIIWASKKGIVSGYGDGTFGKDNNITREQMAKMLMEFAKAEGYGTNIRADLSGYPDQSSISRWARDYMSWAVGSGMIGGKTVDGKLSLVPKGEATRAECATILMRFDKNF